MRLLIYLLLITIAIPVFAKPIQGDSVNGVAAKENFIKQGDAELVISGVRVYKDNSLDTPVNCSGALATTLNATRTKNKYMSGDFYWTISKQDNNQIGAGVAFDFEVSPSAAHTGNQMFEIGGVTRKLIGDSAFGDNPAFKLFIYDRDKSELLSSFDGSTVFKADGPFLRFFKGNKNSTKYTACFHLVSSTTDLLTIGIDDLHASLQTPDTILYQAENTYTARMNQIVTATPVNQYPRAWLGQCVLSSTSKFSCDLIGFNNLPDCNLQVDRTSDSTGTIPAATIIRGESSNTKLVYRTIFGGTQNPEVVNISCVAQGSDRKDPNIALPADSFSTDTANLTYASSAQYTLTTLANAPIGTFITFTYAANTNTRLQTTTAPTQTTADMRQNGMRVYTRAYNSASTAANPAIVAIQIGKGFKGKTLDLYKNAGKTLPGSLDFHRNTTISSQGALIKEYDESSGILVFDTGYIYSEVTDYSFRFSDGSTQVNGYLVINAAKNPLVVSPRSSSDVNDVEWVVGYDYIDKKDVWKRCHKVNSNITTTSTITTWPSGLSPIGIPNFSASSWLLSYNSNVGYSENLQIHYDSSSGLLAVTINGASRKIGAGTKICMEYTKP